MTVCSVLADLKSFTGSKVLIRGIYWNGLRQPCAEPLIFGGRTWPQALNLVTSSFPGVPESAKLKTDIDSWDRLDRLVLDEARKKRRGEIWVTVSGIVQGPEKHSEGNSVQVGGYGHLGAFPAQLVVERIADVVVKPTPTYDYGEISRNQHER